MIRAISDEDYERIKEWGKRWSYLVLPKTALPPHGYVALVNEKPIMAAWMYVVKSRLIGFIAYVIANPDSDNKERSQAFKELTDTFEMLGKELGLKLLFTTTNNGSLVKRFSDIGYQLADTDVVHMIKILEN